MAFLSLFISIACSLINYLLSRASRKKKEKLTQARKYLKNKLGLIEKSINAKIEQRKSSLSIWSCPEFSKRYKVIFFKIDDVKINDIKKLEDEIDNLKTFTETESRFKVLFKKEMRKNKIKRLLNED